MRTIRHSTFESFWALAGPLYESDPARHTIEVTVHAARHAYESGPDPILLTFHEDSAEPSEVSLRGAYLRTPPHAGHLGGIPLDHVDEAVRTLVEHDPESRSVRGSETQIAAFSREWRRLTGKEPKPLTKQRLYELGDLVRPEGVEGQARDFRIEDAEWLAEWRSDYARDVGDAGVGLQSAKMIRAFISSGRRPVLWTVQGEAVSMAFFSEPLNGMSRIGNVYTPLKYRGSGYGSAVTAEASVRAREAGANHIVLFADLANPVSNSIYRRIGFRPVLDAVELDIADR